MLPTLDKSIIIIIMIMMMIQTGQQSIAEVIGMNNNVIGSTTENIAIGSIYFDSHPSTKR